MTERSLRWSGRVSSGAAVTFLLLDAVAKLARVPEAVDATLELGYADSSVVVLGVVLLACTVIYLVPRTAVLGAVLLCGYLGGAVATQLRVGSPLFTHVLFPVYLAVLIWSGLLLRHAELRAFVARSTLFAGRFPDRAG